MTKLTIDIPDNDIETAIEHVLFLIRDGYTSGYYPTWELSE